MNPVKGAFYLIQRFIELGEGYSDLYELLELITANEHRLQHMLALHTKIDNKELTSLVAVFNPTDPGKFQPLYICREGIPNPNFCPNKRYELFAQTAARFGKQIYELSVKPSSIFYEKELYFQYLIGILRLNHYLLPLQ